MTALASDPAPVSKDLLWSHLVRAVARDPGRIALVTSRGRMSFGDLHEEALSLARGLTALGTRPGDTISYQMPNWAETAILVLAAMRIGAICNPIVPIYREREVRFILGEARSRFVFAPEAYRGFSHAAMIEPIAEQVGAQLVVCQGRHHGALRYGDILAFGRKSRPGLPEPDPDADALYLYTSGTEGRPKGVRHSQRTLLNESRSVIEATALDCNDALFMASPLSHITGFMYASISGTVLGSKVSLLDIWDVPAAVDMIETEQCAWTVGATPFLEALVSFPQPDRLKSLRVFRCGGAGVPPSLIRRAQAQGIRAMRTYGCSEHPTVSGNVSDDLAKASTTDGRVHRLNRVRIVDLDDESRILAAGESGEIQTQGPEMFLGYVDPALDEKAFTRDGWLRTGDLGTLDSEGYVTITGRRKDIIIRKGENISAKEVEDLLVEMPGISECAVIGVPDPDRGELMIAVCTPKGDASPTLPDVVAHLSSVGLARQKFPERLELVSSLPVNAAGKILKNDLRRRFANAEAPETGEA